MYLHIFNIIIIIVFFEAVEFVRSNFQKIFKQFIDNYIKHKNILIYLYTRTR